MDGTLLSNQGSISEKTKQIIQESQIPFTLVSARSPMEMFEIIDKLRLSEPQIAFNGGLIFQKVNNNLEIIRDAPLNLTDVKQILSVMKSFFPTVSCSLYDLNNWYAENLDPGVKYEADFGGQTPKIIDNVSLLKQENLKIYKVMVISFDQLEMKTVIENLGQLNDGNLSIKQSAENYLEITSIAAQKSTGIQYIKDLEELKTEEMAAFGDGYNDLSMLEMVGVPIVMDNALDGVKKYARYLTKDNDHDGVGYGIEKFLLKK